MKRISLFLPLTLLALLMAITYSCETTEAEVCDSLFTDPEEVDYDACLAQVEVCTTDTESYYTYNGTTYTCKTVEDCDSALDELTDALECTETKSASIDKMNRLLARTEVLIAEMRAKL